MIAVLKGIWNAASPPVAFSNILSRNTANTIPALPAASVRATLSAIICESISPGMAPMARRIPISTVRSFTVTIMMLLTPMHPASSVPRPTSQIRKLSPRNRLSTIMNNCSVLRSCIASVSSGSNECSRAITRRTRSSSEDILIPDLPLTQIISTVLHLFNLHELLCFEQVAVVEVGAVCLAPSLGNLG